MSLSERINRTTDALIEAYGRNDRSAIDLLTAELSAMREEQKLRDASTWRAFKSHLVDHRTKLINLN